MIGRRLLLTYLLGSALPLAAVINPTYDSEYVDAANVFDTGSVAVVHVTMSPAHLNTLLDPAHAEDNLYYPATVVFSNRCVQETVTNVGIRLRGNTSRYAAKKSYKLSFNEFMPGRRFHGLRKLNLNGEHNDPSIMRSRLCWPLLRAMRIPASRAGHAVLYINGTLFGLFANIEEIDDEFLDAHFGNDNGNLFKCLYLDAPADLTYRSDGRYDLVGGGTTYELQTNEESNDFSGLADFIDVLNNTSDTSFPDAIEQVLNVDDFIRWMAVSALCGSWDDYRYNANNYFLYHDPNDGRFTFIPYDYDNTLGIDFIGRNWATRDLGDWDRHNHPRPLSVRILEIPRYRRRYCQYLAEVLAQEFSPPAMSNAATGVRQTIQSAAELDYASVAHDWGFTVADFNSSLGQPASYNSGSHVSLGILPYVAARVDAAATQLASVCLALNEVLVSNSASVTDADGRHVAWLELFNPSSAPVSIGGLQLSDAPGLPSAWHLPATNIPAQGFLLLWLDGHPERGALHAPFAAKINTTLYLAQGADVIDILRVPELGVDQSYGRYRDWSGFERVFAVATPGERNRILPGPTASVRINEFMADNETAITNPVDGGYDDWIELFNMGPTDAQLQGTYMSDDEDQPMKWRFDSPVTLAPGQHLLLWADGHPEYGGLHVGFRLDRDGEAILLTAADGTTVIDQVTFQQQSADWSYGRYPDGAGGTSNSDAFMVMLPTPGAENLPEPFAGLAGACVLLAGLVQRRSGK